MERDREGKKTYTYPKIVRRMDVASIFGNELRFGGRKVYDY